MTVNLNFLKQNQPLIATLGLAQNLSKHKITVNEPRKTHFSVEGVQSYAPTEIRALKEKEDRKF